MMVVSLILGALLAASVRADTAALESACAKGGADACASLGTITYPKDKEKGGEYMRRACDLGKESACVFYDGAHPRSAAKPAAGGAAPAPDAPAFDPKLIAWINSNVPDLLLALYPVRGVGGAGHFSLDQCRIPDIKLVQLVLKVIKVYNHKFAFKKGCDAEGTLNVQLDTPYALDLKVREFGGVERLTGQVKTVVSGSLAGGKFSQVTSITDGIAYGAAGAVFAKFELTHTRELSVSVAQMRVTTSENLGRVTVSEFQGKPMRYEQSFRLDHIDR